MLTERAGPLPHGWSVSRIGEFAVERKQRAGHGAGFPVLSVTKHHGIVRSDQFFSKRVYGKDTSNYKVVYPGQFAYATIHLNEGSIGLLRDSGPGIVSPMYTVFDVRNNFDPDYLFAALKSKRSLSLYQKITQGTVNRRGGISFRTLSGLLLHHPPLPEQRKISAILSSVDDAIEKTRAVIDQVQVVKRGLMQELLTRGLPGRHTRFKQTEIGEIPEDWPTASLAKSGATVTSGSRGWARYYSEGGALFLRITNLARNTIRLQFGDTRHVLLPQGSAEAKRTRVQPGDLVISITADLGLVGVIPEDIGEAYVNQHLALVRFSNRAIRPEFAGYFLITDIARNRFQRLNDSGAKAGLNLPTIKNMTVPQPPRDEQDAIVEILSTTENRLEGETNKLAGLVVTKSALMSVLLTGELRVAPDS